MSREPFSLEAYLARVGLPAPVVPDASGLRQVHEAQAFTIPFENLDIHLGREIALAPQALAAKLVGQQRGGYCFELNGLLALALTTLGFTVRQVLARVLYGRPGPGPRTHEVLLVEADGRTWVADVGFGGPGLRAPVPLEAERVDEQHGECFRLRADTALGMVLQKESGEAWVDLYAFADEVTLPADIEMANFFTSRWPGSPFRQRRLCALPRPGGRVTLADFDLAIHREHAVETRRLPPGPVYLEALAEHFGVRLEVDFGALQPLPAS